MWQIIFTVFSQSPAPNRQSTNNPHMKVQTVQEVDAVFNMAASLFKIPAPSLQDSKGDKEPRALAAYLLTTYSQVEPRDVCESLGLSNEASLEHFVSTGAKYLEEHPELGSEVDGLREKLTTIQVEGHLNPPDPDSDSDTDQLGGEGGSERRKRGGWPKGQRRNPAPEMPEPEEDGSDKSGSSVDPYTLEVIEIIKQATTQAMVGADILNCTDVGERIAEARKVAIYLVWKNVEGTVEELAAGFNCTPQEIYAAVGWKTVLEEEAANAQAEEE